MRITAIVTFLMIILLAIPYTGRTQTPCVYLAEDILPGVAFSNPTQFTEYAGDLYFSADDGVIGIEVWKWDGLDATLAADVRPGFFSSAPKGFTVYDGNLYFSANDGVNGVELYRWDGTTATLAADINPGAFHAYPNNLTLFDGDLYFTADNGINGSEPYRFDGTTASLAYDVYPGIGGSNILEMVVHGTELCFIGDDGVNGKEPWAWNGATATFLADIRPGISGSGAQDLHSYGSELVFRADNGSNGMELWGYDGSTVYMIMDINPGAVNGNPWELTESGGYLYFRALDGVWGMELWRYDGVAPYLVEDLMVGGPHPISGAPTNLTDVDGYLYFIADNGTDGYELYRHDGTSYIYADMNPGSGDCDANNFIGSGTDVYFTATDGVVGIEVWWWDGSSIILGEDIKPGPAGSSPNTLIWFGPDDIIFNADDGLVGNELWDWPINIDVGSSMTVLSCGDYTAPSGAVYTAIGTYTVLDTIPSVAYPLCDSVIDITLTIANDDATFSYSTTDFCTNDIDEVPTVAAPGGTFDITPSGMIYSTSTGELFFDISTPGTYTIEYITAGACPDTFEVTINLLAANDANFTYENTVYCLSDVDPWPQDVETAGGAWSATPGGLLIDPGTGIINLSSSAEGVYIIKHVTTGVCPDSLTFNLTLINMTTDITVVGNVFTAVETGAMYQWMKCDPTFGLLPIWGAYGVTYIPPTDGCYAVELTAGTCIDTSDCECLIFYGLDENQLAIDVDLFPNPVHSILSIQLDQALDAELYITDEIGRVVFHESFNGYSAEIDLGNLASGVYIFMLTNAEGVFIEKLVKE